MKKTLVAALALATALASSRMIYAETMRVDRLNYDSDSVTLVTATGLTYEMTGCEDYEKGDLVSLVMWSNGTDDVTDDVILSAQYSGFRID